MKTYSFFSLLTLLLVVGCGQSKTVTFEHTFSDVPVQISPPVPQGPNTFQAEITLDLDPIFVSNHADRKKIKDVSISSMNFIMLNERNYDNFETFVVNFFTDSQDMTKLASISPVPKNSTELTVHVTEKAELQKFFADPTLFVIVDANMSALDTNGYDLLMNMKISFTAAELKK
ncbi:MAG: hypothetical protein IAE67_04980 [Candidatus Competibacteraceae bacterium]|nr:hypothetical protein [Candidatus Competibacteraceae bacterium]